MSDRTKIVLSIIVAAVIAGAAALTGAISELPEGSNIGDIGSLTWVVIATAAVVAGAKDLQAYLHGKKVGIK